MSTAYVYDPIYLEHDLPGHPEHAGRLRHILQVLQKEQMLQRLELVAPRAATIEELERVHAPRLIQQVQRTAEAGGGQLDADTYVSRRSFDAALMAAGGVVRAVEAVLSGEIRNAFALVRPPGHHATPTRSMGFCLFNNVAVAARAALAQNGVERVLIVDFDVHHGNGTEDIFAGDADVLYISTHQYPYYPGTGNWSEKGHGEGAGTVLDVPLPPGVGDAGYAQILADLVWPLAERYQPDLVLVSAGYDAHWNDPLAQMELSLTGYAHLARELVEIAAQLCDGRIVFTLEGGYQVNVLAYGVLNAFYAMLGDATIADPLGRSSRPSRPVDELVARLRDLHGLN
jgi:acetoin utilization deacetylase AcuC-like enzyme